MVTVKKLTIFDAIDEETRNQFIEQNIKLVHKNAHIFKGTCNLDYDELFSLSLFGFYKAMDSFDKNNGAAFSTLAIKVMRNEVLMTLRRKKLNTTSFQEVIGADNSKNDSNLLLQDILPMEEEEFKFEDFTALNILLQKYKEQDEYMYNIFFMYIGLDYKTKQIAEVIGKHQSFASRLATRSVLKAKEIAKEMGIIDEVKRFRKIKARN